MPVRFDKGRMEEVLENHTRWWKGELGRPLVKVTLSDAHPSEKKTPAPLLSQESCADFRWSSEQLIEALDEALGWQEYRGDAFPMVNFDSFGPGVLAALCGAKLDNRTGQVWFFPDEEREISDIHVRYDPECIWARRIKDLYRAGLDCWDGTVVMGMPDLGGVLDVAATFRGSENLLTDLYDAPEEVLRLCREIQKAWYDAYRDFSSVLSPQRANTNWGGLLCREPSYILQCDFCYMIGPAMFKKFVLETLREDTVRLSRTIYHLDGVGELNHLDDLLSLEKLDAVQWVYGAGKPGGEKWLDVYRKIQDSGKGLMIIDDPAGYLSVLDKIHGTPYSRHALSVKDSDLTERLLSAR